MWMMVSHDMTMADNQTRDWFYQTSLRPPITIQDKIVILGENSNSESFFADNYHNAKKQSRTSTHRDLKDQSNVIITETYNTNMGNL